MGYTRDVAVVATDAQMAAAQDVALSEHFTLAEFYVHEIPPVDVQSDKLPTMAALAEWMRTYIIGGPTEIKSYYRSFDHNAEVGGAPDSPHKTGDGLDIVPVNNPGFDVIARRVTAAIDAGTAPAFGSMIFYQDEGHIHMSAPGVPNGDHYRLLFSPTKEDGAARSYIGFTTFAQFSQLWNGTSSGGKLAVGLLLTAALLYSLDIAS